VKWSTYKGTDSHSNSIVQVGFGLIGQSIADSLKQNTPNLKTEKEYKVNWKSIESFKIGLENLFEYLEQKEGTTKTSSVSIIWSAGKAGFSASDDECNSELIFFKSAILSLLSLCTRLGYSEIYFHHLSSAGGLFEGQKFINKNSQARPLRPYGHLKLRQEEFLSGLDDISSLSIYRPSSIYSKHNVSGRKGLISVLIENGISNKVTTITGSDDTQRDYVLDKDIADYVAAQIKSKPDKKLYRHFLIDGKASSILEIRSIIERLLNRKLLLRYSFVNQNKADMSFTPSLKPATFYTSSLSTNIYSLYYSLL